MINFRIVIFSICLTIIQQTSGEPIKCNSDSDCPGGSSDKCNTCTNTCQLHCDNPAAAIGVLCIKDCDSHYCECEPGYLRRYDGKCVIRSQCLKRKSPRYPLNMSQIMYGFRSLDLLAPSKRKSMEYSIIGER